MESIVCTVRGKCQGHTSTWKNQVKEYIPDSNYLWRKDWQCVGKPVQYSKYEGAFEFYFWVVKSFEMGPIHVLLA